MDCFCPTFDQGTNAKGFRIPNPTSLICRWVSREMVLDTGTPQPRQGYKKGSKRVEGRGELWEGFFGKNCHLLFLGPCGFPSVAGLCGVGQPLAQVHGGPSWRALTRGRHGGWGLAGSEEAQVDGWRGLTAWDVEGESRASCSGGGCGAGCGWAWPHPSVCVGAGAGGRCSECFSWARVTGGRERPVCPTTAGLPEGRGAWRKRLWGDSPVVGKEGVPGAPGREHTCGAGETAGRRLSKESPKITRTPPEGPLELLAWRGEEPRSVPISVRGIGSFGPRLRSYLQRGCRLLFYPSLSPTATESATHPGLGQDCVH